MDGEFSPGRAADEMRLRGWRVILPFLHVLSALMGLAGLIGSWSGLVMRSWLVSVATKVDPEAVVAKPGTPGIVYAMVAVSIALLGCGLAGIARGERQERKQEELLWQAERRQERKARQRPAAELGETRLAG